MAECIKWGEHSYKGNAEGVMREIRSLGDEMTPSMVVDYAKNNTDSELHKCFTWDIEKAAEKYWLVEAREIIRNLKVEIIKDDSVKEKQEYRVFYKTSVSPKTSYKPLDIIVKDENEYHNLLNVASIELGRFLSKYSALSKELEEVFEAIRTFIDRVCEN